MEGGQPRAVDLGGNGSDRPRPKERGRRRGGAGRALRGAAAHVITQNLTMSNQTTPAETNRAAALEWIGAFNARDDRREAGLRTADYIAHTPESIGTETLDSDGGSGSSPFS